MIPLPWSGTRFFICCINCPSDPYSPNGIARVNFSALSRRLIPTKRSEQIRSNLSHPAKRTVPTDQPTPYFLLATHRPCATFSSPNSIDPL